MRLSEGKWEVKDPKGLSNIIEYTKGHLYGTENITHTEQSHNRPLVLTSLLVHLEREPEQGEWAGYAWVRRN